MKTIIPLVVALYVAGSQLPAQETVPVPPDSTFIASLLLRSPVTLARPTLVILAKVPEGYLTPEELRTYLRAADSLQAQLQATASRWGYVFVIRSTEYDGIRDESANAYYTASRFTKPSLVIARPGSPPRLIRSWPTPEQLESELKDYDRVFRHLTQT